MKRILLVDDYPDALDVWSMFLRSLGYEVLTAIDGLDAVELANRELPDVIVLDLQLPGINGVEAAVCLRGHPETASIPLIAATGLSNERQLQQARDAGFDAVLVKPFEPLALVAEIERVLNPVAATDLSG